MKTRSINPGAPRAFTLLELLVSILVIGLLLAMLIGGAVYVRRAAKSAADRAAVNAIKTGVTQFQQEFGFVPPLVKDRAGTGANTVLTAAGLNTVAVYKGVDAADLLAPSAGAGPTAGNPFLDNRYSERTLAVYLAGGLDYPLTGGPPVAANAPVIDGVPGPGLYKPNRDGTFNIPKDVRQPGGSNRTGNTYQSFIPLGKGLTVIATNPNDIRTVVLRDSRGANVRFYRWMGGRENPAGSGNIVAAQNVQELNIPMIVGRSAGWLASGTPAPAPMSEWQALAPVKPDRDIDQNGALRSATWAIVSAGPDGVFGDESLIEISAALGKPVPADTVGEVKLRLAAESDNIVEVGS